MVSYIDWSVEDFKKLPRGGRADKIESIVIIPSDEGLHDSGFRFMDFAIVADGEPKYIAGYNDIIHLLDSMLWVIDCLPCGLCRIHRSGGIDLDCVFRARGIEP